MLHPVIEFVCNDFSIDGTKSRCFGHYVNDICPSRASAVPKVVAVQSTPHVVFFAKKDIKIGEEIRCDYGVQGLEWRRRVSTLYDH